MDSRNGASPMIADPAVDGIRDAATGGQAPLKEGMVSGLILKADLEAVLSFRPRHIN